MPLMLKPQYHLEGLHMFHHPNGTLITFLRTQHPQWHEHMADKDSPWTSAEPKLRKPAIIAGN